MRNRFGIRISPIVCAFGDSEEPHVDFIVDVVFCLVVIETVFYEHINEIAVIV